MDNNFRKLAEQFADQVGDDATGMTDEELEDSARAFIAKQGIDPAWEEEAVAVVLEFISDLWN